MALGLLGVAVGCGPDVMSEEEEGMDAAVSAADPDAVPPPPGISDASIPGPDDAGTRPTAPGGGNDPSFQIAGLRTWAIVGNALTDGHDQLTITVTAPAAVETVDVWVGSAAPVRLARSGATHAGVLDLSGLAPGVFEVLLQADGNPVAFAGHQLVRSHPIYVVLSTDWDNPDNTDAQLYRQEELHWLHPQLEITHFVGPYTFTDPSVTQTRRQQLANWVKGMRDDYGDEIGLHIHPYCSFVNAAGLTCRTWPAYGDTTDATGYTVYLSAYTESEVAAMLAKTDQLFASYGLGQPTTFRAGGWSAEIHTLRALAAAGYVADTSGCNWSRLEEWAELSWSTLYDWTSTHWATIGDTSQPYYPSQTDMLSAAAPNLSLLEVPDIGLLVDYVSTAEMIDIFRANWPGGALPEPRAYSIGLHPPNFSETYKQTLSGALDYVDDYLASNDDGPAIYVTLRDLALVWPAP